MNRLDEIKAAALDAAQHVTQDERARVAMADDLIRLIGLMVQAVGKSVASDGESDLNDAEDLSDSVSAHTRYLTGERIQDGARWATTEAVAADLSRYESTRWGSPVWRPRCPDCGRRVGMHADVEYGPDGRTFTQVDHADDCPVCRRCKGSGIDPEDSFGGSMDPNCPEPPSIEPCRDCQQPSVMQWAIEQMNRGIIPSPLSPCCGSLVGHYPSCPVQRAASDEQARAAGYGDTDPQCTVLPNGGGPSCDWDPACTDCATRRGDSCPETDDFHAHDTNWSGPCKNGSIVCTICDRVKPGTGPAEHRGDTATLVLTDEVHAWVYAVDGDTGQLARNGAGELWQLCGVCGVHRNDARCIGCGEDNCGGACLSGA